MPIQDIDKRRGYTKGLPLAAVFSKGDAVGNDLDYFRAICLEGFEFLYPFLTRLFGDTPQSISPIYLLGDKPNDALTYWMEERDPNTEQLTKRCDQHMQTKWFSEETNRYSHEPRPCQSDTCHCVRRARLHFRIPTLRQKSGVMGRYLATSGSKTDITEMLDYIDDKYLLFVRGMGYELGDIPFTLSRELRTFDAPDGNGGYEKVTSWLLQLRVVESFARNANHKNPMHRLPDTPEHKIAYLPHLESLFATHLPQMTVEKFAAHYGLSAEGLVATYPQLSQVKALVMAWLIETGEPVNVTHILCLKHRKQFKYQLHTGFESVMIYGRGKFRMANYDITSWRGLGVRTTFDPPAPVRISLTRTNKYKLIEVVPLAELA